MRARDGTQRRRPRRRARRPECGGARCARGRAVRGGGLVRRRRGGRRGSADAGRGGLRGWRGDRLVDRRHRAQHGAFTHLVAHGHAHALHDAGDRARHVHRRLVGFERHDRVVDLEDVARLHEHLDHRHAVEVADVRHADFRAAHRRRVAGRPFAGEIAATARVAEIDGVMPRESVAVARAGRLAGRWRRFAWRGGRRRSGGRCGRRRGRLGRCAGRLGRRLRIEREQQRPFADLVADLHGDRLHDARRR